MIKASALILIAAFLLLPSQLYALAGNASRETPRVEYVRPANGSLVDLTGGKEVVFEWQRVPIPSGGRYCYKFNLYGEDGYKEIINQIVDPRTFSIAIPAENFENGKTYRWRVRQRDDVTMIWSLYDLWYFKVIKK